MKECDFCLEFTANGEDRENTLFHYVFPNLSTRIIFASDNFVVFPSLGQIVEGYLLIATRKHIPSMGHVPLSWGDELRSVIDEVSVALRTVYRKELLLFEHGPLDACEPGASCINHAHLHILPVSGAVRIIQKAANELGVPVRKLDYLTEAKRMIANQKSYLYVEVEDGLSIDVLVCDATNLPSQYMRRLVAEHIGNPDMWDWAIHIGKDRLISTLSKFSRWFEVRK